ncbi:hypothetical protein GCM10027175_17910 [Hymenobacter latericoloratus]
MVGCLIVLSRAPALAAEPAVVVVQVVENSMEADIFIARGESTPEHIEIPVGITDKKAAAAAVGYQRVLARLYAEGYVLQGSSGPRTDGAFRTTTYIFVKAPKA